MKRSTIIIIVCGVIILGAVGYAYYFQCSGKYVNDAIGYSVRESGGFTRSSASNKNSDYVEFFGNGVDQREGDTIITISKTDLKSGESTADLRAWVEKKFLNISDAVYGTATVDGRPAVRVKYTGGGTTGVFKYDAVYIVHPNGKYVVTIASFASAQTSDLQTRFEKFLGSFRFR